VDEFNTETFVDPSILVDEFEEPTITDPVVKLDPTVIVPVVKLGATWCGPCKRIAHIVEAFFASSPPNVICADIDVDESVDLYSYLKQKRMVNGIPVMLMYKKGNVSFAPDDSVTGSDPGMLDAFFKRCGLHLLALEKNQALQNQVQLVR
jgi:thioredoxin 1